MAINGANNLLELGMSGLKAAQQGLATTSHNIANAGTPGYSRQRVEFVAGEPVLKGGSFLGTGVQVAEIRRSYDRFLSRELQADTATAAEQRVHHELAARLDSLLSDEATGLAPVLQGFFAGVEEAAASPTSAAAREVMLDRADRLAERFRSLDARLQQTQAAVEGRALTAVDAINALANNIAGLNHEIARTDARGGAPNDLLDQRDELVRKLSEQAGVTTQVQNDGSINVSIGSGQDLVVGETAFRLAVDSRPGDPRGMNLMLLGSGDAAVAVTDEISGGTLGGLIAFEQGLQADANRQLDEIALGLADAMNRQHRRGLDQRGNLGGDLFTALNAPALQEGRALGATGNGGSAQLEVSVQSATALQGRDYVLDYDGASYRLRGARAGEVVASFDRLPQDFASEGFSIALSEGELAAGDSFIIRPAAGAAAGMRRLAADGASLALAAAVRSDAAATNLGDGVIGPPAVEGMGGVGLADPITLTFEASSGQFRVSSPPGGTLDYDPSAAGNTQLQLPVAGFGELRFALSGSPADGDRFRIEANRGADGDNRNALALSGLQDAPLVFGGSSTLAAGYEQTVGTVAGRTQGLSIAADASEKVLQRTADTRQSVSGVNLDEEATELMRYQRAYEAAARVISVADELFRTFLRATGG